MPTEGWVITTIVEIPTIMMKEPGVMCHIRGGKHVISKSASAARIQICSISGLTKRYEL